LHDLIDSDAGLHFLFLNFVGVLTMKKPNHYPDRINIRDLKKLLTWQ